MTANSRAILFVVSNHLKEIRYVGYIDKFIFPFCCHKLYLSGFKFEKKKLKAPQKLFQVSSGCQKHTYYFGYITIKTDTHLRFTLHFTPLGISFCLLVNQLVVFLILEFIISDIIKSPFKSTCWIFQNILVQRSSCLLSKSTSNN